MATSESDDFESADEELNARAATRNEQQSNRPKRYASIGSDSDDDVDYIPVQYHTPMRGSNERNKEFRTPSQRKRSLINKTDDKSDEVPMETNRIPDETESIEKDFLNHKKNEKDKNESNSKKNSDKTISEETVYTNEKSKTVSSRKERPQRQRKPKEVQSLGAKKLGATKIDKFPDVETTTKEVRETPLSESKPPIHECWEEFDEQNLEEELRKATEQMQSEEKKQTSKAKSTEELVNEPEELMSNLKFKDIFKPEGWEGLDDKYHPILDKLASGKTQSSDQESPYGGWGGWGSWGVSSLLNTATVSVSTLTSHVSHGLSLLEETVGPPDPAELAQSESPVEEKPKPEDKGSENSKESQSQYLPSSFGFGNFMSSVSSITKLVESTSTKVISGGLDTLETIGKKTMEVLQEGDPGLKKKRAFFSNDADKPILSHILREAKEKADTEEKSIEEKQLARKIHFESLFDDYQGLVHLEALEMLSKQCNIKIQQQLVNLDGSELTSMQETLDEVKELCDLGDEDDDDEEEEKDLKQKLEEACKDLGVSITYNKLIDLWNAINSQLSKPESKEISHRELFQNAISALAQFTAFSVERFHKTAELLLIKPRRSTVNEADSLVQLTKTLSSQLGSIANLYCNQLKEFKEETEKFEIHSSINTISLEATNASSYVQEAFRLLIPILQVGAV